MGRQIFTQQILMYKLIFQLKNNQEYSLIIFKQYILNYLNLYNNIQKYTLMQPQNQQKTTYIFQTQTRKLKLFYSEHHQLLKNKRIIFNNSVGTVRYIGGLQHQGKPANSQKQLWVGLEWDQIGRGKHNGAVKGFQYFKCQENSGSLVKFQKIQFGYKLETALFKRYFRAQQLHSAKDIYESLKQLKQEMKQKNQQITEQKKKQVMGKRTHKIQYDSQAYMQTLKKTKRIMVQFVGFDEIWSKINNLDKLQSISLAQCRICDLGAKGHLSSVLTNLRILSMQDNLISDWNQVFQLGLQLPNLTQLSLTNNRIAPMSQDISTLTSIQIKQHSQKYELTQPKQIFPNLKCLILINTGLTWQTLFNISSSFQSTIQQLILCKNKLTDIQNISQQKLSKFENLTFLNVQNTYQTSFDGIYKFNKLPKLQKLIINHNQIQAMPNIVGFNKLKHLSVQYCNINQPIVINQISKFKQLQSLNIKHNPVGDLLGNTYVRMRSVAEISKLNTINGALLKKYDRKDCEIFYLRETFREYFALKKVPDYDYDFKDFLNYCETYHPGIPYFIKKYGNPYQVEEKKEIKDIIKVQVQENIIKKGTGLVQILIKNKQMQSVQNKKVPLSWTISNLKNFFAKVHKIPVAMQKLQIQHNGSIAPQQITQDHKNLGYYNIKMGTSLIISRKVV